MKSYTVEEYKQAGCNEMKFQAMLAVHSATGGRVCDTGCHAFNGGKCKHYFALTAVRGQNTLIGESVRDEAARRNVTIKQVRRERAAAQTTTSTNELRSSSPRVTTLRDMLKDHLK